MARAAHWALRPAVVAFIVATAGLALPTAPATAAGCSTAHGVTVVVDFHELDGGVQIGCVDDGGGDTASSLFPAAGFPLTYVQRQPGFVCRVSGKPADNPCVNTPPADAYWALYWSDGKSGSWTYATSGAGGQHVPDGGYVGFSWNGSDDSVPPGYRPAPHASVSPTPTPTSHAPTHTSAAAPQSSAHPTASSSAAAPSASPSASPGATKASRAKKPKPSASPTAATTGGSPSESESESESESPSVAPASSDPADPDDGGLPGWVAPVVIVVLFGAAGVVAVIRRRQGSA